MNRAGINTSFIEMLITPCYNVCTLIYSCLNTECCCSCTFENESECSICCCYNYSCKRNTCNCSHHKCVLKHILYQFDFMRCLIPIFLFILYCDCYHCCNCCECFDECWCCCRGRCECFKAAIAIFCRGIGVATCINLLFWFFASLAFYLRQIISTFTFFIISFTYLFFVQ